MTVEFEARTEIHAPTETVFDLARDIDLHTESMAGSGERAVRGVTHGLIGLGESVTWRATHFGVPFTMTSRITEFDRPHRFVDEQVSGPFRWFEHQHLFEPVSGGTLMVDRIRFRAPLGPLGRIAERLVLGAYLPKLIAQRNDYLAQVAEARNP